MDNLQNWYCLETMKTVNFVVTAIGVAAGVGAGAVVGIHSELA